MELEHYRRRRDFRRTPEPRGRAKSKRAGYAFVVQKHAARRLHYDFRLELGGTLKSWAVPKGPSLDPQEKRLAVHVEDHPLEYADFEGVIPPGEYGGGTVLVWDRGVWTPKGDAAAAYRNGRMHFRLEGERLQGEWALVRMGGRSAEAGEDNWLLKKIDDEHAGTDDLLARYEDSVVSGRTLQEIAAQKDRVWRAEEGEVPGDARAEVLAQVLREGKQARLPVQLGPQLATLVERPPAGERWLHEIKYDGYRTLCKVEDGKARLLSRGGHDWTARFARLAGAIENLGVHEAWLDGEVVVLQPDGTTSFEALQEALSEARDTALSYFLFDLLYLDGVDLSRLPLRRRKEALAALLASAPVGPLRYSDHLIGEGPAFYRQACEFHLEGVVSKLGDRPYRPGRGRDWLKIKCLQRQEFVIGGYTDPTGSRAAFGALLLGVYEPGGKLVYAGRAGTGFTDKILRDLHARLAPLVTERMPFAQNTALLPKRGAHWVEPELVAEIEFTNWTRDGVLRHPSFQGLREDKPAREVRRERPANGTEAVPPPAARPPAPARSRRAGRPLEVAGVRLTNPDKELYPVPGVTKHDLALYYESIADWILPHLAGRPLTLVRCPEGGHKDCFYQKHANSTVPAELRRVPIAEKGKTVQYLAADSLPAVIALVQMGVLEIHTWGARADRPDAPDRLIFDLDPDEGLDWADVLEAAHRLRARLADLGLESFVKTTGGKGLHVVMPLARRHTWPEAKDFSHAVAKDLVHAEPHRYTTRLAKAARPGKIFIDYLRNAQGATAVAAYSTRARAHAPVSVPLAWDELSVELRSDHFNVHSLPERLRRLPRDPWAEYADVNQSITKKMKKAVGLDK